MQAMKNSKSKQKMLLLPSSLLEQFGLIINETVTLKFGSAQTKVRVGKAASGFNATEYSCTRDVAERLKMPENTNLRLKQEGQGVFRIGPVIGVLTFPSIIENKKLHYYKQFAHLNRGKGFFYVFSSRLVDSQNKIIRGFYYDYKDLQWKEGEFPFPDAVIDRCYPNNYKCQYILEKEIGRKIFNKKTCINKLEFAKAIEKDIFLRKHIPETRVFRNTSDLEYFLKKFEGAFLKPVNGMMGKGIIEVECLKDKLQCKYVEKHEHTVNTIIETLNSKDEIHEVLGRAFGRKRTYIAQQPIQRMEYKGGPFSFRVWAMKNGEAQWVVPGMFAKYSVNEGFLTNFTAGAKMVPLTELLSELLPILPYSKPKLMTMLETLTLKTAEVLDKRYGPLGELGIDIVLDLQGKPWVIEANGNPGKAPIFLQKEYPAWRTLVFTYPFDYAAHLAGFETAAFNSCITDN